MVLGVYIVRTTLTGLPEAALVTELLEANGDVLHDYVIG